jgi:hypothetical protein
VKDWTDATYALALAALLCVTFVAVALIIRLTKSPPDDSVECVRVGGTWGTTESDHCERRCE